MIEVGAAGMGGDLHIAPEAAAGLPVPEKAYVAGVNTAASASNFRLSVQGSTAISLLTMLGRSVLD